MKAHLRFTKIFFILIVVSIATFVYGGSSWLASKNKPSEITVNRNKSDLSKFAYLDSRSVVYDRENTKVLGAGTEQAFSVPVLAYHGVLEEARDSEDVSWNNFKNQMFILKINGYETITLFQLQEFLLNGKSLPKKSFLLTFDDGRKDSYYPVDPILKELNYEAVIFVITSRVSDKDNYHLSKSELKEMLSTGRWDLESHSENAHKLDVVGSNGDKGSWLANKLWLKDLNRVEDNDEYRKRITDDLIKARENLSTTFGIDVNTFAFPYGDYGQNNTNYPDSEWVILDAVKSNYRFSFYQPWGELGERNYPGKDTFMIRRITVHKEWTASDLLHAIESGEDKEVGYADSFQKDNGWITKWGKADIVESVLLLHSTEQTSGATTYLNGTELWDDYEITAKVVLEKDTDSFSIIARADRFGNYSYCNFGRYSVSYNEKVDGQIVTRNRWNRDFKYLMSNKVEVGIRVEGDKTACLMNKGTIVKDRNIKITQNGGMVGFSIWSSKANAEAQIFSLTSTPTNNLNHD